MKELFEQNQVGELKSRLKEAPEAEIDRILGEYEVPSPGELDLPGCYIQNTVRELQTAKKKKNDLNALEYSGDVYLYKSQNLFLRFF